MSHELRPPAAEANADASSRGAPDTATAYPLQALRLESGLLVKRSHDIRTPLNGIMGMSTLLMDTGLSDEQREYVAIVRASGRALLAVLDDILDFSALSAGGIELRPVPVSLRAHLVETLRVYAVTSLPQELELVCDIAPEVPDMVLVDPQRLRQVCMNLLSNAIRATQQGLVRLLVVKLDEEGDRVRLRFTVEDSGVGIAADALAGIFDGFVQVDPQARFRFGGAGLGLPLSAELVRQMGGRMKAESSHGAGSRFSFELPLTVHSSDPLTLALRRQVPSLLGVSAAVAVAPLATRSHLLELLGSWGLAVRALAANAALVDQLVEAKGQGSLPQVLLLDGGPAAATLDLASRLRHAGLTQVPIVAFAPTIHRDDAAQARRLGLAGLHVRPVGYHELLQTLHVALALTGPIAARPRVVRSGLRILVAEDNPVNSLLVTRLLERQGHGVVAVRNGREAVERFAAEPFDAVLMDLVMPEMDGYEATRGIRAHELGSGRRTPIIAVTAESLDRVQAACAAAGLDACVAKPLEPAAVVEALMSLVG